MKSICKTDFFDPKTFEEIKNFVFEKISDPDVTSYAKHFKKYYGIVSLPSDMKEMLLEKAKKETGDDSLEIIYSQVTKYQIKDGLVPDLIRHKDKVNGEWVMDIVVDANIDWPLIIDDKSFSNIPNSVFFIKGEDDWHWRPNFPSVSESDYVLLLFVHLANKDSEYATVSRQIFGMEENALKSFLKSAKPAWGKYNEA
jgi:hypothetical protein